jgi:hypothetical protein
VVVIESGATHRFASFTWPGLLGVATGMNDAGLAVADLMALDTGPSRPKPGIPVLFAVRSMLEQAGSVEEALAWLKSAARTIPQNYALVDASSAYVVETSNSVFRLRKSAYGIAAATNYWREDLGGAKDQRYAGMLSAAGDRKLGAVDLQAILGGAALRNGMNVQAVVLEPGLRAVRVARGKAPLALAEWDTLDLSPWLAPAAPAGPP